MVRAENRSERRVAGNIRTSASRLNWRNDALRRRCSGPLPSRARAARRIASNIGGFCRTLRSRTAGIGTELLAPREKIEVMRPSSPFERSPVPMGRAIRR